MPDEPDFVAGTLVWCNEKRAEKDLQPLDRLPKGRRGDPGSCPCGTATGLLVEWRSYGITHDDMLDWPSLPLDVILFVEEFDAGRLPQYDIEIDRP